MRSKGIDVNVTRTGYYERLLSELADYQDRGVLNELLAIRGTAISDQRTD
jgi:hypothetical protein